MFYILHNLVKLNFLLFKYFNWVLLIYERNITRKSNPPLLTVTPTQGVTVQIDTRVVYAERLWSAHRRDVCPR
jgi:hypothetical protein